MSHESHLRQQGWDRYTATDILGNNASRDDLCSLADFYHELPVDRYEPDSNRFRRHSRGVYLPWENTLSWIPNAKDPEYGEVLEYDMKGYNSEFLSDTRYFPAIPAHILNSSIVQRVIGFDLKQTMWMDNFSKTPLSVGVGCIMLKSGSDVETCSTPNMLHQDGGEVALTFIHLITRKNILGGENYIADSRFVGLLPSELNQGSIISEFSMKNPLDSFVVHNSKVCHHVSPIVRGAEGELGERSILIVAVSPLVKQL